jgi:hypothetical protein
MRSTCLSGAAMLLLSLSGCAEQAVPIPAQSAAGPPRIHIPHASRSLGEIPLGPHEISIEVFNRGQADLVLMGIATSCACTDADVKTSTVPGLPLEN